MVHMIKKKLAHMDWKLLIPYFILSGIGILMVYSSSSYRAMTEYNNSEYFFYRQIIFAVLGMFSMFVISLLSNRFFKRKNLIHAALVLLFLVMFYLIVAGTSTKGARGWIYISSFGFQPAEFIKVVLIMYLALFISGNQAKIKDDFWQTIKKPGIVSLLAIALIFIQPDLGGAAIISFICLVLFLHSGIPLKYGVGALGIIMASYFSLIALVKVFGDSIPLFQSYQMERITSFINPFADSQNSGYQVVNSYYALSRGGLFGVGIGESIQKSGYLPEAHTDFILSIIGEELGSARHHHRFVDLFLHGLQNVQEWSENERSVCATCLHRDRDDVFDSRSHQYRRGNWSDALNRGDLPFCQLWRFKYAGISRIDRYRQQHVHQ